MFEKFDISAIQVYHLSEEEMMLHGFNHIDFEMLVAGLLRWYGPKLPAALSHLDIVSFRKKFVEVYGTGVGFRQGDITQTPALQNILQYAYDNNSKVTASALLEAVINSPSWRTSRVVN